MEEVILHIGIHKTGSSSIQSALKGYSENRVRTASFDQENHSIPIYTIFSEDRHTYHIWQRLGYNTQQIDTLREEFLQRLRNDVHDEHFDRLIISGEDINALSYSEREKLIQFFQEENLNLRVVAYVRNPLNWVVSITQGLIKNAQKPIRIAPAFKSVFQPFLDILPKDNIHVSSLEDVLHSHGSVIKHFADTVSINLTETNWVNESLSPLQLSLAFYLNKASLKIAGNKDRHFLRKLILGHIQDISQKGTKYQELDKEPFFTFLHRNIPENYNWLRETFGIRYEIPDNIKPEIPESEVLAPLEAYFDKVIGDSHDVIPQLFANIGCDYIPDISLADNFLEAYSVLGRRPNLFPDT